jgi:hypothetical protein
MSVHTYSLYTYSEHVNELKLLLCPRTFSKLCGNTLIFNVLALLKVVELNKCCDISISLYANIAT